MESGRSLAQKASREPILRVSDPLALGRSVQEVPTQLLSVMVSLLEVQPGWGSFRWLLAGPTDVSILGAARRTTTSLHAS